MGMAGDVLDVAQLVLSLPKEPPRLWVRRARRRLTGEACPPLVGRLSHT